MTTYNHTPITVGAAANALTFNSPIGQLDAAMGNLAALNTNTKASLVAAVNELNNGMGNISQTLKEWAEGGDYEMTAITYHVVYPSTVYTAIIKWPDGSAGVFTATTINSTYEAIDAYTISHTVSGLTVTQAAVTRNSDGNITVKPALTVA